MEVSSILWYLIFMSVVIWIFFAYVKSKSKKKYIAEKKPLEMLYSGKYLAGLPSNVPAKNLNTAVFKDKIVFLDGINQEEVAEIELNNIQDVSIEDATTMESRVTATRMLAVGIFAFALKKDKKTEIFYTIITTANGKFTDNIIFEFQGLNSRKFANSFAEKVKQYANAAS